MNEHKNEIPILVTNEYLLHKDLVENNHLENLKKINDGIPLISGDNKK